jgi:hypothetical protein
MVSSPNAVPNIPGSVDLATYDVKPIVEPF